jgi:Fe-S-cluster containining protein
MGSRVVYALRFHADYQCRHSGACCTANWDVPVELPVYKSLAEAVSREKLHTFTHAAVGSPFILGPDLPGDAAAILERDDEGRCVFFAPDSKLCIVHRDLGENSLPATCRHFPRVAVQDPRGIFVSLSHFCPTAASMLFRDDGARARVEIVAAPPAFPEADYEGLVVDIDDLPPLLTPRMLMDFDGYTAWERHMVARCRDVQRRPASVLATLERDARLLVRWRPGAVRLCDAIAQLPREHVDAVGEAGLRASLQRHHEVIAAVPDDLKPHADEAGLDEAMRRYVAAEWERFHAPINRYLAAKAFASWTAYQGRGIRTIVRGLDAALALVRVEAARQCRNAARALDRDLLLEAFRAADFLLNHLAVGEDLAKAWSVVEISKGPGAQAAGPRSRL